MLICIHVSWYIFTCNYFYKYKKTLFSSFSILYFNQVKQKPTLLLTKLIITFSLSIQSFPLNLYTLIFLYYYYYFFFFFLAQKTILILPKRYTVIYMFYLATEYLISYYIYRLVKCIF